MSPDVTDRSLWRAALASTLLTIVACGNVDSRAGALGSGGAGTGGSSGVRAMTGSGGDPGTGGGGSSGTGGGVAGAGGRVAGTGGGADGAVAGAGGGAAGAGGGAAGVGGHGVACSDGSGCPGATTPCAHPTCVAGQCGIAYGQANTVVTDAVGNCHKSVCDGTGSVVSAIDDSDLPVDGNPCTSDLCSAGVASNPKLSAGTICSSAGACDTAASCKPLTFRVLRVGDGQAALSAASTAVFVEERRVDGTLVSTVALPTAASGAMQPFTMAGSATSEGGLALSSSGRFLTAAGYATPPGTASVASTTAASVFRSAARIDVAGNVDTSTSFSTAESGYNARSAVFLDGAGIWISGSSDVWYGLFGAATQAGTTVLATPSNVRWLAIFGGQLFGSSGSSGFTNVFTIGAGLPVTVNQTATPLPGLPTTGASPYGFVFFDLDATVAGNDTLYLADDMAGLQKWTFDGSSWSQVGTLNLPTPVGFRGVAGFTASGTVTLMASTAETGADRLVVFVDDGVSTPVGTPVATSPVNTMFRGLALSPHF